MTALSCSVVVPCKNEVDNVAELAQRLPKIGSHTELIFVDGTSTDGTPERIAELIAAHPERDIKLLRQPGGGGKAAAVRTGFDAAQGDVLIILDADMTVAPEELPGFHRVLEQDEADFANGTRFSRQMEPGAMRATNYWGNKMFAAVFSWLLGQRVGDTLCGTKAIRSRDWPRISAAIPLFGEHDRWGDFDLLLGAAYSGLRIKDVPTRYGARRAGESKMHAFRDGASLARTWLAGVRQLKLRARGT